MAPFQALLLGVVQGLTEFLPVSSSGHLVIFQHLLGFVEPQITFDVVVHAATLVAVMIFFRSELFGLISDWTTAKFLLIGSIPAGLVGLLFKDQVEALFGSLVLVGGALLVTGSLNMLTDKLIEKNKNLKQKLDLKSSLTMGVFQAMAIMPGISRSGSTIAGGVLSGLSKEKAFTLSFLLSVPAVGGAFLLQLLEVSETGLGRVSPLVLAIGFGASLLSGYASLWFLKKMIVATRFEIFGWYCMVVGAGTLFIGLM